MESLQAYLKPEIVWLLVGIGLLLLEFTLPGVIILFFALGAMVTAVVCLLQPISINTQLLIFAASSVVMLLTLRQWLRGVFLGFRGKQGDLESNVDDYVGLQVVVTQDIAPPQEGRVELHGVAWRARADELIRSGTTVEIIAHDNLTVTVKPLA